VTARDCEKTGNAVQQITKGKMRGGKGGRKGRKITGKKGDCENRKKRKEEK